MKRFKLLLVALATVSFAGLYSCNGGETNDETTDSIAVEQTEVEPKVEEETPEMKDSTATENNTEATEETSTEETK